MQIQDSKQKNRHNTLYADIDLSKKYVRYIHPRGKIKKTDSKPVMQIDLSKKYVHTRGRIKKTDSKPVMQIDLSKKYVHTRCRIKKNRLKTRYADRPE